MLGVELKHALHLNATTFTHCLYLFIVVITGLLVFVSEIFILSQAVLTGLNKDWTRNDNRHRHRCSLCLGCKSSNLLHINCGQGC